MGLTGRQAWIDVRQATETMLSTPAEVQRCRKSLLQTSSSPGTYPKVFLPWHSHPPLHRCCQRVPLALLVSAGWGPCGHPRGPWTCPSTLLTHSDGRVSGACSLPRPAGGGRQRGTSRLGANGPSERLPERFNSWDLTLRRSGMPGHPG